ncbi:MAG: hypothetical protein QGF59_29420, partial [Pirellulaceae bacterium]|nr:hypothetical protein [Pirellulaceae bacterium]
MDAFDRRSKEVTEQRQGDKKRQAEALRRGELNRAIDACVSHSAYDSEPGKFIHDLAARFCEAGKLLKVHGRESRLADLDSKHIAGVDPGTAECALERLELGFLDAPKAIESRLSKAFTGDEDTAFGNHIRDAVKVVGSLLSDGKPSEASIAEVEPCDAEGQHDGVRLISIALLVTEGDDHAAKATKKRWTETKTHHAKLPPTVGEYAG